MIIFFFFYKINTFSNFGALDTIQRKLAKAAEMYQRARKAYEKVFGYDHPRCKAASLGFFT